jgi:glycosyltransferase involved in cell wall biosynthesis
MYQNRRVAVVIPCYDVGDRLATVLAAMPRFVDAAVVVDDGSAAPVYAPPSAHLPVVVLRHETNRGLARAMETGLRAALDLGAEIVVKVDGDGQMDPAEMERLVAPIAAGHADIAKGNRFLRRSHLAGMPAARLAGNLVLSFLSKLASGYWNVFDPTNGYIAVRRQVLDEIDPGRLGPGYFFEISLLCQAFLVGAVVRDVSMPARYNGERSSLSIGRAVTAFPFLLLQAYVRRMALQHFLRDFTPVALFLIAGVAMLGSGLVYGTRTWLHSASLHQETPTGTIVVVAMLVLAGFHLLVQALVMDIASVPSRSPWASLDAGTEAADPARESTRASVV